MPDPTVQPHAWTLLVSNFPDEWKELVNGYTEYEDTCTDRVVQSSDGQHEFTCSLCASRPAFTSAKALASHIRCKHKVTNPLNKYIDNSGICPVCATNFYSRTRVLAHVSETRIRSKSGRQTCRQILQAGHFPKIGESTLADATLAARTERREAQRRGRTHTLATLPAKRQEAPERYSELRPLKRLRIKTAPADITFVPFGIPDALKRRRIEIKSR